jgi:hypothetical protein
MKIKFELDIEDLLEEDFDYFEEKNELRLKDDCELKDLILEKIKDTISNYILNNYKAYQSLNYEAERLVKNIVDENKQIIIDNVVKEVSKKIINLKQVKDFKKSLEY